VTVVRELTAAELDAGIDPARVSGRIMLRGKPLDVDDTLLYLAKQR
jgi:hypothetical protein